MVLIQVLILIWRQQTPTGADIVGVSLLGKGFKVYSDSIDHFFCFLFLLVLNALHHIFVYFAEHTGELNLLTDYLCILTI